MVRKFLKFIIIFLFKTITRYASEFATKFIYFLLLITMQLKILFYLLSTIRPESQV